MKYLQNLAITKTNLSPFYSFPLGITAMSTGLKMLNHLYREDSENHRRYAYNQNIHKMDYSNLAELKILFLINITSYTIITCNLEKIIERSYKEFIRVLELAKYKNYHLDKNEMNGRKKEIQDFQFYRNKIFAHTSFGSPKFRGKIDSKSLQLTSIDYFAGNLSMHKKNCLALGGGSFILNGEVKQNMPIISIVDDHKKIVAHFQKWEFMFTKILKKISKKNLEREIEKINII